MDRIRALIEKESKAIEEKARFLEANMPKSFFEAIDPETHILIARQLLSYEFQDKFSPIYFKHKIIVLSEESPDADLKILKKYKSYPIRYYRTFLSKEGNLRIAFLYFRDLSKQEKLSTEERVGLVKLAGDRDATALLEGVTSNFLRSMGKERLSTAVELFFKARKSEQCQFEIKHNPTSPKLQIVMAWRNVPKAGFLYEMAQVIAHHKFTLQKVVASHIEITPTESVLLCSLGLDGSGNLDDFLRELCLIKYFDTDDTIGRVFETVLSGNDAHLVRNFASFTHQTLLYQDPHLYSFDNVVEALCRHPELTKHLVNLFALKFDPTKPKIEKVDVLALIDAIDTGSTNNDNRRKAILKTVHTFIEHTLKTNFYRQDKSGFSFRLDPKYLDKEKFPETPYAIFFIRGMHYIGFNIRFKDLARGGVRTVLPNRMEQYLQERNTIFNEAYNLSLTQQKKNKDIPEGGAKTVILLEPESVFEREDQIYQEEHEGDIAKYKEARRLAYIYDSQKSFIDSFLTLINCDDQGTLRAKSVIDYYKKPEYIYLGPDENMFNDMIVWIANFAVENHYKPGHSFMSSKPGAGINHKEYGITSFGIHVYIHQVLLFLGIDPEKQPFTIKISGGPDGDVAGNELLNLYKHWPKTAKLLALTDGSGTINDPEGLDLATLADLFHKGLPIRNYPADKLHNGGFLLDLKTKREESAFSQQTLLYKKENGKLLETYISGNEMNQLYRNNLHQTVTDIFMPGGGRPRTLNETNWKTYLTKAGKPTSKAIVEGANLYLTPAARHELENLGVLIIKDSSANKSGVTCSSFEVLAGLCMDEKHFMKEKTEYVKEVLEILGRAARNEANLLLSTHKATGAFLTDISEKISQKINLFKYQILDHLEPFPLTDATLIQCLINYCPPLLRAHYGKQILALPPIHQKAIIACYLASHIVYTRGIEWSPNIADVLLQIAQEISETK